VAANVQGAWAIFIVAHPRRKGSDAVPALRRLGGFIHAVPSRPFLSEPGLVAESVLKRGLGTGKIGYVSDSF